MPEIFNANNITEALEMAKKFKLEGKYDLFRGQPQNWKVISSLGRLTKMKFQESQARQERLYYYINTETSLKKYRTEIDSFFAIAQHYGIPTNYIDFTTNLEIAFYFATNSKFNKANVNCAIICLKETDFNQFIDFIKVLFIKDDEIPPYISKIKVDNLWRLQAQSGCFLFTPYPQIEYYYKFDRIVFPYTTSFNTLTLKDIYPVRKSELEILLDHFFSSEQHIEGMERLKKFAVKNNMQITKSPPHDHFKIIKKREIHKSWYSYTYRKWHFSLSDNWKSSIHVKVIKISLHFNGNQRNQIILITNELKIEFIQNRVERGTPLMFDVITNPKSSKKNSQIINRSCLRIWDGTRNLPYTEEEIILMISQYIYLEVKKSQSRTTISLNKEELITIEMTNKYGSRTKCEISSSNIVSAFRGDINSVIIDSMLRPIPSELLLYINKPRYIFDFKKLITLFKTELVANQILFNSKNSNPVIFFTPSQIKIIGYA